MFRPSLNLYIPILLKLFKIAHFKEIQRQNIFRDACRF
jgi:hypothetical protein